MAQSKTRELLNALTEGEQKMFPGFLESPLSDGDKSIISLYNQLITSKKDLLSDRPAVHRILFPGKPFDEKQFRYLVSDLNKQLIHFMAIRQLQREPDQKAVLTARALSERDCEKSYRLLHLEISSEPPYRDALYYKNRFEHAEQHLVFSGGKLNRKETPDYSDTLNYLDIFYLVKKLQLACEVTNLANILNKHYDIALLNEIRSLVSGNHYNDVPAIKIYFHILGTLTPGNQESHFIEVRELLSRHHHQFHPRELSEMYQYLKNYCVRQVNSGITGYLRTLFEIYNDILNNRTLMGHDYLSQWEFKNMVSISLRLNEKSWCETFIRNYISYLKPDERDNALAYNTAYYLMITGEYRKAIRKLQEVALNDVFYQLDARVILLKCYFELDDSESYFYQTSSFRLFLLRNRHISAYQRRIYRNLIRFLTAIVRANGSKTKLQRIRAEIEKEKNIADLNWILSKIDEATG